MVCLIAALIFSSQSFAFAAVEDEVKRVREDTSVCPELDELLELYAEHSLYTLSREQAILAMLRNFIIQYEAAPLLADSLLTVFDPFGGYYSKTTIDEMFGSAYRGYGFVMDGEISDNGHLYNTIIKKVFDDSPAYEAGFKTGDIFLEINGINVEGMGIAAVSNLLNSIENRADFVIERTDERINIALEKGTVYVSSLTFETLSDKTALLTIENFTDVGLAYDFYTAMLYLEQEKYENLIIDLRGNSGGDLIFTAQLLDMLVTKKDVILYSIKEKDGSVESLFSSGEGFEFNKIAVLVNNQTASASEIFAQSLREITGAVIIGSRTFGKGIGQDYMQLKNGDVAAITSFEIISSAGISYNREGIAPDITVNPLNINVGQNAFEQLNFVNCVNIKQGADNKTVLALNQRLAAIGYIPPDDVKTELTDKTAAAVEILQKVYDLPVGISEIDHTFIECLNQRVLAAPAVYEPDDAVLARAVEYILNKQ